MKTRTILSFLLTISIASVSKATDPVYFIDHFDAAPVLAASVTPNAWYPDRFPPKAFENTTVSGRNVLREAISTDDALANRPLVNQGSFYNWQGRKYSLGPAYGPQTALTAELYIPSDWQTHHRVAMMWGTGMDNTNAASFYVIFGFRNMTGDAPGMFVYNLNGSGTYSNIGYTIAYDTWYTLKVVLTETTLEYYINNVLVATENSINSTTYFNDLMLQAYNFGDATLPVANQAFESYDVYWDNVGVLDASVSLPVELSSFTARSANGGTELRWRTATEKENHGFAIERTAVMDRSLNNAGGEQWVAAGFVTGAGTSNMPKEYSFVDTKVLPGTYRYRLKQIDNSGTLHFSSEVEATVSAPSVFTLGQNYPNPFNPSTTIGFTLSVSGPTTLTVYDAVGREVAELVNEDLEAGVYHERMFDASRFSSGVYFARLTSGGKQQMKKMVLLK